MNNDHSARDIPSPCVSICALDDDDICIGCHRSGHEITQWGNMSPEQKRHVMDRVRERETGSLI